MLKYITDAKTPTGIRVVLWQTGTDEFQIEIGGKNFDFTGKYYQAVKEFAVAVQDQYVAANLQVNQ